MNSHFAAHQDGRRRRNEQWAETFNHFIHDFEDEGSGGGFFTCGGTDVVQPLKVIANKKTYADHREVRNGALDDKFDAIIWVGDFNSRIQEGGNSSGSGAAAATKASVRRAMNKSEFTEIFEYDQFQIDQFGK